MANLVIVCGPQAVGKYQANNSPAQKSIAT